VLSYTPVERLELYRTGASGSNTAAAGGNARRPG